MNKRFALFGREKEIDHLRTLYTPRKNVVIVGSAGIGKTSVLRQVQQALSVVGLRRHIESASDLRLLGTAAWLGASQAQRDRT